MVENGSTAPPSVIISESPVLRATDAQLAVHSVRPGRHAWCGLVSTLLDSIVLGV
jgi:hypothetical protein